ncbi:MAG TPA: hypothetical protein VKY73_20155 [Polyangiaceae bacterium]|nr:hypothetical protein [Polyangiaceae bacterium]
MSPQAAEAGAMLRALETTPDHRALAQSFVKRGRDALVRAEHARAAGQHARAQLLEALAIQLSRAGTDLVRAVTAERKLRRVDRRTADIERRAMRAQALLEQTVARRGRAAEQLEAVEKERGLTPTSPAVSPQPRVSPR